jgi:hypothetical protein
MSRRGLAELVFLGACFVWEPICNLVFLAVFLLFSAAAIPALIVAFAFVLSAGPSSSAIFDAVLAAGRTIGESHRSAVNEPLDHLARLLRVDDLEER